jgi:hypothetical protein
MNRREAVAPDGHDPVPGGHEHEHEPTDTERRAFRRLVLER